MLTRYFDYEDRFLGMIQKNLRTLDKVQVVYKRGRQSEITKRRDSISTMKKQVAALEQLIKQTERQLQELLEAE